MKQRAIFLGCISLFGVWAIAGCSDSTAVSKQPSQDDIQAGIQRRLDAIDKDQNMTPQAKEIAKARIRGQQGNVEGEADKRASGVGR